MAAKCALVNLTTNQVENLIVADASDPVQVGYLLVTRPPDWVQIGTDWRDGAFVERNTGIETL